MFATPNLTKSLWKRLNFREFTLCRIQTTEFDFDAYLLKAFGKYRILKHSTQPLRILKFFTRRHQSQKRISDPIENSGMKSEGDRREHEQWALFFLFLCRVHLLINEGNSLIPLFAPWVHPHPEYFGKMREKKRGGGAGKGWGMRDDIVRRLIGRQNGDW